MDQGAGSILQEQEEEALVREGGQSLQVPVGQCFPQTRGRASKGRAPRTLWRHKQAQEDTFIVLAYFRLRVQELTLQSSREKGQVSV